MADGANLMQDWTWASLAPLLPPVICGSIDLLEAIALATNEINRVHIEASERVTAQER